ncbi:MAG: inositol monophosphatase [Phenylobacterium sp.]|uniref:inositol monophosphatase family protein n=1 Tax=Phenylobacterium sp. TaxID=1871053 RepID=UPI001A455869|nr:inositol monophosphatase family protein [Phenylobacterium sp.]MBL8555436.1 inositol monophosphatase [Phenylobacterium sp.]
MPSQLLETMIEAARVAGDRLKQDFADLASLDVRFKNGAGDPFSEADLRAEETVKSMLARARPAYGFLGEEGGLVPGSDPDHVWVVDPLDGTMNFVRGVPFFAVNIALAKAGDVLAGVTYVPMMDEMFWAERGGGAFLNGAPIRVAGTARLEDSVLAIGIPFAGKPRQAQFHHEIAQLTHRVASVRRLGAGAVDTAYVACGRFDAYWEQSVSPWDMAAGAVLVREAGGVVTNTAGGPLDIMGGNVLNSAPGIHAALLEVLRPIDG